MTTNPFIEKYMENRGNPSSISKTQTPPTNQVKPQVEAAIQKAKQMGYSDNELNAALKKRGYFSPSLNKIEGAQHGGITKASGAVPLGEKISGGIFSQSAANKNLSVGIKGMQDSLPRIDAMIAKKQSIGEDVSRLQKIRNETSFSLQEALANQREHTGQNISTKQAAGSALQLASMAVPATALAGKAAGAVGLKTLGGGLTNTAAKSTIGAHALEGGLSGFGFGIGKGMEEDRSAAGSLGQGLAFGAGGAALGPIVGQLSKGAGFLGRKIAPELADGISRTLGTEVKPGVIVDEINVLRSNILREITGGSSGTLTKNPNLLKNSLLGKAGPETSPEFIGAETFYKGVKESAPVVRSYNKKKGVFNKEYKIGDGPIETSDAIYQMRGNTYKKQLEVYESISPELYPKFKQDIMDDLAKIAASKSTKSEETIINQIREDIANRTFNFKDIGNSLDSLGKKTKSKMQGNSENTAAELAQDAKKAIENRLDTLTTQFKDNAAISRLKEERQGLAAIQKIVDSNITRLDGGISAKDLDVYGVSNMIAGGFFGNLAQVAKGGAFTLLKAFGIRTGPFQNFNKGMKTFKKLDDAGGIMDTPQFNPDRLLEESSELASLDKMAQEFAGEIDNVPPALAKERLEVLHSQADDLVEELEIIDEFMKSSPFVKGSNKMDLPGDAKGAKKVFDQEAEILKEMKIRKLDVENELKKTKIIIENVSEDANIPPSTKEGLIRIGTLITGALASGLAVVAVNVPSSVQVFENTGIKSAEAKEGLIGNLGIDDLKKEIAHRETGVIQGDKYKYIRTNNNGTRDLGKYQTNTDSLKTWAPKVFGKAVSEQEFLASPDKQEKFFEFIMNRFATEYDIKDVDTALALWHKGWGNLSEKRLANIKNEAKEYLANRP